MKQYFNEITDALPFTKAQAKQVLEILLLFLIGAFLLIGGIVALTDDASAQDMTSDIFLNVNHSTLNVSENVTASVYALSGNGEIREDESGTPSITVLGIENVFFDGQVTNTNLWCWHWNETRWETIPGVSGGGSQTIPSQCNESTIRPDNEQSAYVLDFNISTFTPNGTDYVFQTVDVLAHDYEVQTGLVVGNVLAGGQTSLINGNFTVQQVTTQKEESFLTASAFTFDGWQEHNVVFALTILILMTIAAYHGWIFIVFASMLTIPIPVWNELSSTDFPWGFGAFILLYTVGVGLQIAFEWMGGMKRTSDRGGMF